MLTIDTKKLEQIGLQLKDLLPSLDGNVQFNLSKCHDVPKVNVNLADVTKVKK